MLVKWGTDLDLPAFLKCKSYFPEPSTKSSEEAQSIPISTILLCPDVSRAYLISSRAASPFSTSGAKPP